jgi:hypothetical protein
MPIKYASSSLGANINGIDLFELGHALSHCWDLPMLQKSRLARLQVIAERALEESHGLEMAKAVRKELIACAEQLTQRSRYSIEEIITAIEKEKFHFGSQDLVRIQRAIGIRLPRNKIDLARYYTIRLVMEGIDQQTIAEFLDVDQRTVANYISQAKERILLILESKSMMMQPV